MKNPKSNFTRGETPLELSYISQYSGSENEAFIAADEVGRGSLFGPVSVGAVWVPFSVFTKENFIEWRSEIRDSKKLSAKKREILNRQIRNTFPVHISHVSSGYIDKYNINRAVQYALYRCIQSLVRKQKAHASFVLLDGNYRFEYPQVNMSGLMPEIHTVIGGDDKSFAIGMASIAAKVERDELISSADSRYPEYALSSNAGYGTKQHREALKQHGLSKHHRTSFLKKIVIGNNS